MAVLEVPLLSGFRADIESLEQVRSCCWAGVAGARWGLPSREGAGLEPLGHLGWELKPCV